MARRVFEHDPSARLDYGWDWSDWLAVGETISAATVTPSTGLTVSPAATFDATTVTAWVSTDGTEGSRSVTCHITTSAGRQDDRTHYIYVVQR